MDPVLRLNPSGRPWRVVLDTDTANEIDDQFAIAHACLSPDRMRVEAICAAPFRSRRMTVEESVTASIDEICNVLSRLPGEGPPVYRGSDRWLKSTKDAVESEAADAIIEVADSSEEPLLVLAIGAATNVASALNMRPDLIGKVGVVWLGGHSFEFPDTAEFNLTGDPCASKVLLDCGVDLVLVPAKGASSHLITTVAELERYVEPAGPLGRYLTDIVREHKYHHFAWGKEIWDVAVTAWAIEPSWVPTKVVPSPILNDDFTYSHDPSRHPIRYAYFCVR
ncbi:MAG: nucleoside hydrolase, partial [Fimbriimonadales bacterium]